MFDGICYWLIDCCLKEWTHGAPNFLSGKFLRSIISKLRRSNQLRLKFWLKLWLNWLLIDPNSWNPKKLSPQNLLNCVWILSKVWKEIGNGWLWLNLIKIQFKLTFSINFEFFNLLIDFKVKVNYCDLLIDIFDLLIDIIDLLIKICLNWIKNRLILIEKRLIRFITIQFCHQILNRIEIDVRIQTSWNLNHQWFDWH